MKILHTAMRFFSYLFTLAVSAFLTGIGTVAFISDLHNWKVDTFVWTGKDLSTALVAFGVLGGVSVLLALFNLFRFLLPLVAAAFFGFGVYGFFIQGYKVEGVEGFQWMLGFLAGLGGNFLCSLMEFKRNR